MKYFIINNASRAATYGIGTYIRQLTAILKKRPQLQVYFIDLYSEEKEFTIEKDEDSLTHYKIPASSSRIEYEKYCRMAYYLLLPYLSDTESAIFHFNYFQHYPLAQLLKSRNIHNRIFLSVHYLNWCFELNGNVSKFREIISASEVEDKYTSIVYEYSQNKHFLHLADDIIVLSLFCKNLLQSDYGIHQNKLHLVYNGLQAIPTEVNEKPNKSQLILFVGRLDKIKGVDYLIKAFRLVLNRNKDARLLIVGDGDYNEYLKHCNGIWDKITFTGKISQKELSYFYQQATIGVLPSFHEQCSYTAIEFMMHGIPFIGTDSTGLSEMLDSTPQLRVPIKENDFSEDIFIQNMANAICSLLENVAIRKEASLKMLTQFKEKYTLRVMEELLSALIEQSETCSEIVISISSDFFQELDDFMISLIHDKADIDTDFYGMAGIGIYLWWRLEQTDMMKDEHLSFKIKEYLIYYIDWFYESVKDEQKDSCDLELAVTLNRMYSIGFYKTKVELLMDLLNCKNNSISNIKPMAVLQNAMRMFTTKI